MENIQRVDKINNIWMTWVRITDEHSEIMLLDHEPTETEAQTFIDQWINDHQYDDVRHLPASIYDMIEVIEEAVKYIKTTASLTLTKWNTYLNGLPLEDR